MAAANDFVGVIFKNRKRGDLCWNGLGCDDIF